MQLGLDNLKRGVEVRAHATVLLNLASDAQLLHSGGWWPDADLLQRHLLRRLLGVKRTRYAQCELFRV
jgi:hypothetical protein